MIFVCNVEYFYDGEMHKAPLLISANSWVEAMDKIVKYFGEDLAEVNSFAQWEDVVELDDMFDGDIAKLKGVNNG